MWVALRHALGLACLRSLVFHNGFVSSTVHAVQKRHERRIQNAPAAGSFLQFSYSCDVADVGRLQQLDRSFLSQCHWVVPMRPETAHWRKSKRALGKDSTLHQSGFHPGLAVRRCTSASGWPSLMLVVSARTMSAVTLPRNVETCLSSRTAFLRLCRARWRVNCQAFLSLCRGEGGS